MTIVTLHPEAMARLDAAHKALVSAYEALGALGAEQALVGTYEVLATLTPLIERADAEVELAQIALRSRQP